MAFVAYPHLGGMGAPAAAPGSGAGGDFDESIGWHPALFVDGTVPVRYACAICKRVPRACVELSCPSHEEWQIMTFCELCIKTQSDRTGGKCPLSGHTGVQWNPSGFVRKDVMRAKVRCLNALKAGGLAPAAAAAAAGSPPAYGRTPPMAYGSAEGSGTKEAVTGSASFGRYDPHSSAGDSCHWTGPLGLMKKHLDGECAMASGMCAFSAMGCTAAVTGRSSRSHAAEGVVMHLGLLRSAVVELKGKSGGGGDPATAGKVARLMADNESMKTTIRSLTDRVSTLERWRTDVGSSIEALRRERTADMDRLRGDMAVVKREAVAAATSSASASGGGYTGGGGYAGTSYSGGSSPPASSGDTPSTLPMAVVRATAIIASRGPICRAEDSRWNHQTSPDAVSFQCSKAFILRGIGVLVGEGTTTVEVRICRGDNASYGVAYISRSDMKSFHRSSKAYDPEEVSFPSLVYCEADTRYTVEVYQKNQSTKRSFFVKDCTPTTYADGGFTFRWSNADHSPNGTDVDEGGVISLYIVRPEVATGAGISLSSLTALSVPCAAKQYGGGSLDYATKSASAIVISRGNIVEEMSRWNHRGSAVDAIEFEVDKGCFLRGVGVLPCAGRTRVQVRIIRGRNERDSSPSSWVAHSDYVNIDMPTKAKEPVEILLNSKYILVPDTSYTIEVHQTNSDGKCSCLVENGIAMTSSGGITIRWANANSSPNGTDTDEGGIPCVFLLPSTGDVTGIMGSVLRRSSLDMSGGGPEFEVKRGDYETASWRWNHGGSVDGLCMCLGSSCYLSAVGFFPGKGSTSVRARVIDGANREGMSWEDSRVVGRSRSETFSESYMASSPRKVRFMSPVLLRQGKTYTIEIHQRNASGEKSYFVQNGKKSMFVGGVSITFSNANYSPNGSDVDEGTFPSFYLKKI